MARTAAALPADGGGEFPAADAHQSRAAGPVASGAGRAQGTLEQMSEVGSGLRKGSHPSGKEVGTAFWTAFRPIFCAVLPQNSLEGWGKQRRCLSLRRVLMLVREVAEHGCYA